MKFLFGYILLTLTVFSIVSNGHISINIDPEDLDGVNEFVQAFIANQHEYTLVTPRTPLRCKIMKLVIKTTLSIIQLIGVTVVLVGSNLIKSTLDQPRFKYNYNQLHNKLKLD